MSMTLADFAELTKRFGWSAQLEIQIEKSGAIKARVGCLSCAGAATLEDLARAFLAHIVKEKQAEYAVAQSELGSARSRLEAVQKDLQQLVQVRSDRLVEIEVAIAALQSAHAVIGSKYTDDTP